MPCGNKKRIEVYVTNEEYRHIKALSSRLRISQSSLLRKVIMDIKLPDLDHPEKIIALASANADMARLGNLLKMTMNDDRLQKTAVMQKLIKILNQIETTRKNIKQKMMNL